MYTNPTPFNVSTSVPDPMTRNKVLFHFSSQGLCSLSECTHLSLFANSRGCTKNENTSPGPLMERSIKIVRRTVLRTISYDIQGAEGKKEAAAITGFLGRGGEEKSIYIYIYIHTHIKHKKHWWGGALNYLRIFTFCGRSWNLSPAKSEG